MAPPPSSSRAAWGKNYTKKEDERKKERETRRLAVVDEWEKVHPDKAYKQQRSDGNSKDVMSIEE